MTKRILATCFFPAFDPPMSGGELKLLRFYEALSAHFHIDLVTFTYPGRAETIRHTDTFHEHRVPKPPEFNALWGHLAELGYAGEMSGIVSQLIARGNSDFRTTMERLWERADAVFYDFPFLFAQDPAPQDRSKIRVYNSHNFEGILSPTLISGGGTDLHRAIARLEEELCQASDLILATSSIEARAFSLFYDVPERRIEVMPLGFSPADLVPGDNGPSVDLPDTPFCFFIGSQHEPNYRAAREVLDLAKLVPELEFVVAGAVCDRLAGEQATDNVHIIGRVSEEDKRHLFARAGILINPIREGAGMNVKVVEALGAGLPVVTTTLGARGFDAAAAWLSVADTREGMAAALRRLAMRSAGSAATARKQLQQEAEAIYSWRALAASSAAWLERVAQRRRERATQGEDVAGETLGRISLYLNDFPIGDGAAGGQKRMLDLISAVPSAQPKVMLTQTQDPTVGLTIRSPDFFEINIPVSQTQRHFEARSSVGNVMSISDVAAAMHVRDNAPFMELFRRLSRRASSITFEHCYLSPLIAELPSQDRPQIIYSSYNVEADLKAEMLRAYRHTHGEEVAQAVRQIEELCAREADVVLAVTAQDADRLQDLYRLSCRPEVILNGTRIPEAPQAAGRVPPQPDQRLELIFIGSAHPPNVTAAQDLVSKIMPALTNAHLTIIGSVCEALDIGDPPPWLQLAGRVSEEEKTRLLARAHVAVNPLTIGGGSSLKVGDFLAAGLPVVTTAVGVRGFDLHDDIHVLMADPGPDFVAAIERLRREPETWSRLAVSGERFARETLDWRRIGARVSAVQAPAQPPVPLPARPSVLAITYRYTEPRRGGPRSISIASCRTCRTRAQSSIFWRPMSPRLSTPTGWSARGRRSLPAHRCLRRLPVRFGCFRSIPVMW